MPAISNRHDILVFFDVTNGNPNGDPDAGNLPRTEPNSGKGLVSDVCLKRKVRNVVSHVQRDGEGRPQAGFNILVQQGNVLNTQITAGIQQANPNLPKKPSPAEKSTAAEAAMRWLCRTFYDVRTFGAVLSTGEDVMKGSAYGQVRGPVQFTFGMSLDPIPTQEITITRCAVTKEEDAAKERTMGNKHIVPYGLYAAKAFVSPIFAERTGFDEADLSLFFDALKHLFSNDQSAARAEMNVRAVYDFEHVGTQTGKNAGQNQREAMLGCAPAHKLFEKVGFRRKAGGNGRTFPASFDDYELIDEWRDGLFPGVKLNRILDPKA
jgi:CRISPR-associated protein Csd2